MTKQKPKQRVFTISEWMGTINHEPKVKAKNYTHQEVKKGKKQK